MAWKEITEIDETETTESPEEASHKEKLCECICEIKEILSKIHEKMCESDKEDSDNAETIVFNQRKHM